MNFAIGCFLLLSRFRFFHYSISNRVHTECGANVQEFLNHKSKAFAFARKFIEKLTELNGGK